MWWVGMCDERGIGVRAGACAEGKDLDLDDQLTGHAALVERVDGFADARQRIGRVDVRFEPAFATQSRTSIMLARCWPVRA